MSALFSLLFAPIIFLYTLLKNWEFLAAVDRIEGAWDAAQAELFSILGYNLTFTGTVAERTG